MTVSVLDLNNNDLALIEHLQHGPVIKDPIIEYSSFLSPTHHTLKARHATQWRKAKHRRRQKPAKVSASPCTYIVTHLTGTPLLIIDVQTRARPPKSLY
jgi:succinate dehydrogenase/fumarate reductase-like Fe-S protein